MKKPTFATNAPICSSHRAQPERSPVGKPGWKPPRYNVTVSPDIVIIAMYSAIMNIENFNEEYSVW